MAEGRYGLYFIQYSIVVVYYSVALEILFYDIAGTLLLMIVTADGCMDGWLSDGY